jgi:phosphatidyl-myo-inositol dimannoside synthase
VPRRPVLVSSVATVRVLTITSSYPKFPGDTTAPFIESITRELAVRGHELTVVLPERRDLRPAALPGVRFRPYRYAPWAGLQVFGYAEALRSDVALRSRTLLVAPAAILSGLAAIFTEARNGGYDVVHAHWVVPSGAMASVALLGRDLPLVVSLHGSDVFLAEKSRIARRGAERAFRRASAVTACSRDLASRSVPLGARETPEVIPYGVDVDQFRPDAAGAAALRRELGLAPDRRVVFAVGRLVRKKGFDVLVDAAAELHRRGRKLTLVIAGRGDLEQELLSRARDRGIADELKLVGNVERGELPGYFSLADVVVVPSVQDAAGNVDGLPNVLLEAMASEKAIVATNVAGIPDALASGKEGILVPAKDASGLADGIEELLSSDTLRASLGERARVRAREDFSWKRAGERFESVLRSVAGARGV